MVRITHGSAGSIALLIKSSITFAEHAVSAYLLAAAALGPFYSKFSNLADCKSILYPVIIIFLVSQCLIPFCEQLNPVPGRVRALWCCTKYELAYHCQSSSRDWRRCVHVLECLFVPKILIVFLGIAQMVNTITSDIVSLKEYVMTISLVLLFKFDWLSL